MKNLIKSKGEVNLYNSGNGTNNIELENAARQLKIKNFKGVFMNDQLKNLKVKANECGIVNSKPLKGDDGHWTCWWRKNRKNYYFDSYGLLPSKEVIKYLGKPIEYNTFQLQNFNQSNCGERCLDLLNKLSSGEKFKDIVLSFVKTNTY